jgi:hypothetical protein
MRPAANPCNMALRGKLRMPDSGEVSEDRSFKALVTSYPVEAIEVVVPELLRQRGRPATGTPQISTASQIDTRTQAIQKKQPTPRLYVYGAYVDELPR